MGTVDRTLCTVPSDAFLFFPLVNIVDVNTTNQTVKELLKEIKALEDGAHDLHASVDGVAIDNLDPASTPYRTTTRFGFNVTLPGNNLLGLAAGSYYPAVADGYYLLLAPLGPGAHAVSFGGTDGGGFVQDVTYNLTALP